MDRKRRAVYEMKAEVLQAAGHPLRLAMLDYLRDGEQCVCDIAEAVGAQRSNVSRHLAVLQKAGLVTSRKDGLRMMYRLETPCVLEFSECVTKVVKGRLESARGLLARL